MGRSAKQDRLKKYNYFDYTLLFIIIFLIGFGLVMLFSTSSYEAMDKFGDSAYYLKQQGSKTALGILAMIIFARFDYHRWQKWAFPAYVLSFLLCAAVLVPGLGVEHNGSRRWLGVGPIEFQPSEIAKVATILFLAVIISKMPRQIGKFKNLIKVLAMVAPMACVIAINNLSTAIIIVGIAVVMTFVASPKVSHFVALAVVLVAGGTLFILLERYRADRLKVWLHPEDFEKGYQTLQGLYAIGSGGIFGKGLGESMQKLGYVPEAQNDMIFSIICEELGLFGAICVILLFLLMIWRFMVIANNAKELYGSLLVVGILAHIAIQVILNIAVVTNTIPNTGIILPFISYGGTSVVFLLVEMGLALSVSRSIHLEE